MIPVLHRAHVSISVDSHVMDAGLFGAVVAGRLFNPARHGKTDIVKRDCLIRHEFWWSSQKGCARKDRKILNNKCGKSSALQIEL